MRLYGNNKSLLLICLIILSTLITSFLLTSENYTILYIFPHPDDESYGPGAVINKNVESGHEVHLLTLTKGGATRLRHDLGLSVEEMGKVRYREMLKVEELLKFSSMEVHDLPDGGLKELDPRKIEEIIRNHILKLNPDILVTYPVHGISAHNDHIVTHAAVKRVFLELKGKGNHLKRLAFFHVTDEDNSLVPTVNYKTIKKEETDCVVEFSPENVAIAHKSLDCYVTYQPIIESSNIKAAFTKSLPFDFFMESFDPPVSSLTSNLK